MCCGKCIQAVSFRETLHDVETKGDYENLYPSTFLRTKARTTLGNIVENKAFPQRSL
jgi:hypothetical protein